ncbi:uncharacterized protein FIESC28_03992 [Fusarium coffeatum]|uniref:Uncharacterized protein n=1 Tax=Fusarium coffeatum TaxID=231269 RepID=A0A366S3K2_9HYPO|nr:uncharacterized protein FIESC28_03992 [Fusarium coffeatum]RBR23250.1 hypothetical protein FIESC28_03992 [Fusarium coffeatum]
MESSTQPFRVPKFSENLDLPQEVIDHPLSRSLEDVLQEHDAHVASSTNSITTLCSLLKTYKSKRKTNTSSTNQGGVFDLKTAAVERQAKKGRLLIYRQRLARRYARLQTALCSKLRGKVPKASDLKVPELKTSEK